MIPYIEVWNLYNDATLRTRATVACMQAAANVFNEDPNGETYPPRKTWAEAAFANPEQAGKEVMWSVVSNTAIGQKGGEASDEEIQQVVNNYVDVLAKRYSATKA